MGTFIFVLIVVSVSVYGSAVLDFSMKFGEEPFQAGLSNSPTFKSAVVKAKSRLSKSTEKDGENGLNLHEFTDLGNDDTDGVQGFVIDQYYNGDTCEGVKTSTLGLASNTCLPYITDTESYGCKFKFNDEFCSNIRLELYSDLACGTLLTTQSIAVDYSNNTCNSGAVNTFEASWIGSCSVGTQISVDYNATIVSNYNALDKNCTGSALTFQAYANGMCLAYNSTDSGIRSDFLTCDLAQGVTTKYEFDNLQCAAENPYQPTTDIQQLGCFPASDIISNDDSGTDDNTEDDNTEDDDDFVHSYDDDFYNDVEEKDDDDIWNDETGDDDKFWPSDNDDDDDDDYWRNDDFLSYNDDFFTGVNDDTKDDGVAKAEAHNTAARNTVTAKKQYNFPVKPAAVKQVAVKKTFSKYLRKGKHVEEDSTTQSPTQTPSVTPSEQPTQTSLSSIAPTTAPTSNTTQEYYVKIECNYQASNLQVPTRFPTSPPVKTLYPTRGPSTWHPTQYGHSFKPTVSNYVSFDATQSIIGISYATYALNASAYDDAIVQSIVKCIKKCTAEFIQNLVVTPVTGRRLTLSTTSSNTLTSRQLQDTADTNTSNITVSYTVNANIPGTNYTTLTSQLNANVASGRFAKMLGENGQAEGVSGFYGVTATVPTEIDTTAAVGEEDGGKTGGAVMAGIVIGVMAGVVLFGALGYYFVNHAHSVNNTARPQPSTTATTAATVTTTTAIASPGVKGIGALAPSPYESTEFDGDSMEMNATGVNPLHTASVANRKASMTSTVVPSTATPNTTSGPATEGSED